MRIGILLDGLGGGGAEYQAILSVTALRSRGHDAKIVVYSAVDELGALAQAKGAPVIVIAATGVARICSIRDTIRRQNFDILHAFKGRPSMYGFLSCVGTRTKFIAGFRGLACESKWERWFHRSLCSWGTPWIVNSNVVKRFICSTFGISEAVVSVVPNGGSPNVFCNLLSDQDAKKKLSIPNGAEVVAIIAGLRPVKNHEMFLKVACAINQQRADVCFLVVGDGPEFARIRHLAAKQSNSAKVQFLGRRDDVPGILAATDILLLTSHSEGLPNVLIEAAYAGVPRVSTKCGGADELITHGETGFLVEIGDVTTMANTVLQLLEDAQLTKRIASTARGEVSARYTSETMGQFLESAYQSAMRGGNA